MVERAASGLKITTMMQRMRQWRARRRQPSTRVRALDACARAESCCALRAEMVLWHGANGQGKFQGCDRPDAAEILKGNLRRFDPGHKSTSLWPVAATRPAASPPHTALSPRSRAKHSPAAQANRG
jgi:hypothetical protein